MEEERDNGEPTSITKRGILDALGSSAKPSTRALGNVGCTSTGHPDATAAGTAYWYRRCGRRPGRRDSGKGVRAAGLGTALWKLYTGRWWE